MKINPVFNNYNIVNFKANTKNSKNNNVAEKKYSLIKCFKEKENLTEKYGIIPDEVKVVSSENIQISDEEKALLIEKILESHELAKKNYNFGNIARISFATNIGLADGSWYLGTNFNNTRNDISSICGERTAIVGAYNKLLKSRSLKESSSTPLNFKVKYLAMANHKDIGTDKNGASPCAECLSWLNTQRYFDNDTTIASLEKNKNGKYSLRLNTIGQYLPYRNEVNYVLDKPCEELDIKISKNALEVAALKKMKKEDFLKIAKQTKKLYKENQLANVSGQNIAAIVIANGETFTGQKIDFSKRWFMEPALYAASKAIEKYGNDTKIDCICYSGNSLYTDTYGAFHNDGVVSIKTLGFLETKYADRNTLVISSDNDSINVRTIDDYLPQKFKFHQTYEIK